MKQVTVTLDVYRSDVHFLVTRDPDDIEKFFRKRLDTDFKLEKWRREFIEAGDGATTFTCEGCPPVVWLPRIPKTTREIGTLSHECLHVVNDLADYFGFENKKGVDEPACYALGYLVSESLRKMK